MNTIKEDGLLRPERQPLGQNRRGFWNEKRLQSEMRRVFNACHSCRRCHSLCHSFPTLFDLIDNAGSMDVDGVRPEDYWKVVDSCFLCDLCFLSKCPYVPPHEWNIDFPHLMLRAKAVRYRRDGARLRDRLLSSPDKIGRVASRPLLRQAYHYLRKSPTGRKLLHKTLGIHKQAWLPEYPARSLSQRWKTHPQPARHRETGNKVAIFATCYGNYSQPQIGEDLICILEHNNIQVKLIDDCQCCAMPRLELGDLDTVNLAMNTNIPRMAELIADGWDIVSLIPSCTLMFKQELPLMFPERTAVLQVKLAIYDPFEYLMRLYRSKQLKTDFRRGLGRIAYHVACHQRAQRAGQQTRKLLELIPDTEVTPVERCSGHDGSYAMKSEHHVNATSLCAPVARRIQQQQADAYTSDCFLAGHHISNTLANGSTPVHPISLLRRAYAI